MCAVKVEHTMIFADSDAHWQDPYLQAAYPLYGCGKEVECVMEVPVTAAHDDTTI